MATTSNAASLQFGYTIVQSDRYDTISFLITTTLTSGSSMDKVSTVVIDKNQISSIKATDLLGTNGLKIATSVVNNYIATNYKNMPRINGISEDANFYVTDEAVWFVFDKYEIAPGSEGIQSVPVYFDKIDSYTVDEDDYYNNKEKYNVRMVPLRQVIYEFGYDVRWEGANQEMKIYKVNGNPDEYTPIKLGQNSYRRMNELSPQVLEAPPEVGEDGRTYVPISFMESILDIHYQVMTDGSIEFATYVY